MDIHIGIVAVARNQHITNRLFTSQYGIGLIAITVAIGIGIPGGLADQDGQILGLGGNVAGSIGVGPGDDGGGRHRKDHICHASDLSATIIGGGWCSQCSDLAVGRYGRQIGYISDWRLVILDGDRLDNLNGIVAIDIGNIPADGGYAYRVCISQ